MTKPRIYFYCRDEPSSFQEDVVALAEGFHELGVPFSSNCNYWKQSSADGDYLVKHDPAITPDDCDVVVVSYTWAYWNRMGTFDVLRSPLPAGLFKKGRRYRTVCMDNQDGHRTFSWDEEFRQFDLVLRSHLNRRANHPANFRPWVIGYTDRVVRATVGAPPFAKRQPCILINFGASHHFDHGTRKMAHKCFEPKIAAVLKIDRTKDDLSQAPDDPQDALLWQQTGHRYARAYYERLKSSQAVACFTGELMPPMPFRNPQQYLVGGNRARIRRTFFQLLGWFDPRPPRAVQWDSFRFWESLVAGCAAFNLDLDLYGVDLPVLPENWKHYVGVRLDDVDAAIQRIRADPGCLARIAAEGHRWVRENYSPLAMARRFLDQLNFTP